MNIKSLAVIGGVLVLAACGNGSQDPAKLKGGNFVTKSGDMEITLSFAPEDMRINGRAMNLYNASYTASGDSIQFGDMLSTMMAGPEDEMQAEQEYFQFMSTVEKYSLDGGTLILKNANGQEIVFQSIDTPETPTETTESEPVAEQPAPAPEVVPEAETAPVVEEAPVVTEETATTEVATTEEVAPVADAETPTEATETPAEQPVPDTEPAPVAEPETPAEVTETPAVNTESEPAVAE